MDNIIFRLKQKDEKAFDEIYQKYHKLVYFVVYNIVNNSEDTADLCQEVFCTVYDKIDQFVGGGGI